MTTNTHPADEVLAKIERAMQTTRSLCEGRIRWTMSVPARTDSDPDLVIADALASARALLSAARQDDVLIARQAREIAELKERLSRRDEGAQRIYAELYCIGGPLNDNKLGYTKEQIEPFRRIATLVED